MRGLHRATWPAPRSACAASVGALPNKALELTGRHIGACQALQPPAARFGGRFAGRAAGRGLVHLRAAGSSMHYPLGGRLKPLRRPPDKLAMRRKATLALALCLAWGATIAGAFQLGKRSGFEDGGRVGFVIGSENQRQMEAVYSGITALKTLQQLPPPAAPELRDSFERDIDSALLNSDIAPSRFDVFRVPLCADPTLLAAYRSAHASPEQEPSRLKAI